MNNNKNHSIATRSGMDVKVSEGDVCPFQLQGPRSPHVAYKLFGQAALDLGYYHVIETELNGLKMALSRTGWSGELGSRLVVSCPDGPRHAMVVEAPWFPAEKIIPPGIGKN